MTDITDQPPPVPTDRRPAWDLVIEYTEKRVGTAGNSGAFAQVLADMRERDAIGRARYGVPLTSGNGRDHLVDAYQEALDMAAYLAAELDECGAPVGSAVSAGTFFATNAKTRHVIFVQHLFGQVVDGLITLRVLMAERQKVTK